MEAELITLRKKLNGLDDIQDDVWKIVNDWERKFWFYIGKYDNNSKYDWCLDKFNELESKKEVKDSFRNRIACYGELYIEIDKR